MPRLTAEFKEEIKNLPPEELRKIVLKVAAKDKMVHDFITVNYLDKKFGEQDMYEDTLHDLEKLILNRYIGRTEPTHLAKLLEACIKRINEFTRISKNKKLEADLLVYVLSIPLSYSEKNFGTCFTRYDNKVAQIVKRLINIVTKKLHKDYRLDYEEIINRYLTILHTHSHHLDSVYTMPKSLSEVFQD
ncbi:MAG: hypothetical protein K9I94_05905 [Bacteroidales bacterium]|nr:hypothetical protein [Bacteroidales bacterium]